MFQRYQSALSTRLQKHYDYEPRKLILMTRWHEDDLPGRILYLNEKKLLQKERNGKLFIFLLKLMTRTMKKDTRKIKEQKMNFSQKE